MILLIILSTVRCSILHPTRRSIHTRSTCSTTVLQHVILLIITVVIRPERCIVTIASLDQRLYLRAICRKYQFAAIVNHWSSKLEKPLKNHRCQWLIPPGTIDGDGKTFSKTIAIPSLEKNNHRHSIALKNWPSFRSIAVTNPVTSKGRGILLLKIHFPSGHWWYFTSLSLQTSFTSSLAGGLWDHGEREEWVSQPKDPWEAVLSSPE